ncbi:MAG: tetratricopeptide repeat protein, partial [Desulfobacterales bacterium]|nr:tetratricopeptide repeat protein [Desulfobacterales bacterium]
MDNKIILTDAFKYNNIDQDKILPPEETVKRFKEKLKKIDLDILEDTVRIDNGRLDIPVYFSICGNDAYALTGTRKQMGKGGTTHQAEASAVMELAERFSLFSFRNNPENFLIEKYRNIKDKAVPFEMIAQSVNDDSDDLEIAEKIFEDLPFKWTKAFNLTQNREILIPFDWFFTINEFNGACAGNCVEEAISQGMCEVVERHVSSIISHKKLNVPSIRADSATDPIVVELIKKYRNAGIKLYISDFSLQTGIPTAGVLAYDPLTFPKTSEIVWTAGTTLNPQKSLSRALTEVAQLAGDFNTNSNYVASGLPKFKEIEEAEFVINPKNEPKNEIDIKDLPDLSDNNIKVEIESCISALKEKGMEVIVINTMNPELEIPAFYTIIPGAHFRERAIGNSVCMFATKHIADTYDPETAVSKLQNIENILPEKYYIKFYLGSCHLAINDPGTALSYFKKSLELEPAGQDIPSIYSYMGVCLKDMGEYRNAVSVLMKGEELDAERTDIYNSMGFCYFKLKEHERAIDCFKKVLRINPGSAIDYANIASNYREMGKPVEAIQYYETALSIDPGIDFARYNLEKLLTA